MDIAQLRIRIWNKVKDFDLMKSIMADVEEYISSRNDGKPHVRRVQSTELFCTCSKAKGFDVDEDGLYCVACGKNVKGAK